MTMNKHSQRLRAWYARVIVHPAAFAAGFWVVVLALLFLIMDQALMPIVAGRFSFTSPVPQVQGKTLAEARQLIEAEDLVAILDTPGRYSAKVPEGGVLIQIPAAGRVVKEGRAVHLILSKGQRELHIPELRGKSLAQAQMTLNRLGFVEGEKIPTPNSGLPRGVVVRTQPSAGQAARVGDRVKIFVSGAVVGARVVLPDLVGLSLERSSFLLDSLGLSLGQVKRTVDAGKNAGTVLSQNPLAGSMQAGGGKVDLVIAD